MTKPANKSESDEIKKRSKWRWLWAWMFYDAKWAFVVIFALMFGLSVLYLAPLKVILLTGLLAFLTSIFTRRQRVIIWLCGWLFFWAVFTWSFIEGNSVGWRIWQFDDELAQLETARAVPLQENAAPLYDELFRRHDALFFDELFYRNDPQFLTVAGPWKSTQFPALAEWLDINAGSIDFLVEITQKDLRRYKNTHGRWPEQLGLLADSVEPLTLVDPLSSESFIYKLNTTEFMLYSKGENNIDDNGLNVSIVGADDFRIWPIDLKPFNGELE